MSPIKAFVAEAENGSETINEITEQGQESDIEEKIFKRASAIRRQTA